MRRHSFHRFLRFLVLLTLLGGLAACSQKAEALRLSVHQFGTATETAFDAYGDAHTAQFAPVPKSISARQADFMANVEQFTGTVTPENLPVLLDPDAVRIDPAVTQQWQNTLRDLRNQYQTFVAIFTRIGDGSALGASAVKESGPILEKLRGQLDAIAADLAQNGPQYLVRRGALIAKLNQINSASHDSDNAKSLHLQIWWQDWQALMAAEQALQADTLRSFLTASELGAHLQTRIDTYAQLDMTALMAAAAQGISLVDHIHSLSPEELVTQGTALINTATGTGDPL
ncbi:MAG: hypothetical protein ABID63_02605 [Pseudomonadota bacterium]